MKTEKVLLSQVKVNKANPRTITEAKLRLLVERLLVFPKMISLRPVVVDNTMTALGGNMRLRAFGLISQMSIEEIGTVVAKTKNFQRMNKSEREALLSDWQAWLDKPTLEIVKASELSDAEKKEFIIADNASFGEWDYDKLGNEWDSEELNSWGVDVWNPDKGFEGSAGNYSGQGASPEGGTAGAIDPANLPAELQGQDIDPDKLPKIEGSGETAMERIIIVFPKDRAEELAMRLGLERIDKVVYNIDELDLSSGE